MSIILKVDRLKILSLPAITFSLEQGECLAVLGVSGIGKSLLFKSISDLVVPKGKIFFRGQERESMSAVEWRKNVRYCGAETGWWADHVYAHFDNQDRAKKRLAEFGLKESVLEQVVSRLSTGQRQRLGLLRAMIDNPPVLLLDEPTASLDEKNKILIEGVLKKALSEGAAICMITHDMEQAQRMGDYILRLSADDVQLDMMSS